MLFLYAKARYHRNNHMLELDMQKLGLNEKETLVYLAALELGYASAQNIAKKAGINRATTYFVIEGLMKRGLMTQIEKDKKTFFAAEEPKGLSVIVERKERDAEEMKNILKNILPQLESIYNLSAEKPKIRYYEGLQGIETMRMEFLNVNAKETFGFISLDRLLKHSSQQDKYTHRRVEKKVKSKVIYTRKDGPLEGATDNKMLREARYVPQNKFNFANDISVYGDRLSIVFLEGKLGGVMIENKELADMMRAIFELAWEGAEKYQK